MLQSGRIGQFNFILLFLPRLFLFERNRTNARSQIRLCRSDATGTFVELVAEDTQEVEGDADVLNYEDPVVESPPTQQLGSFAQVEDAQEDHGDHRSPLSEWRAVGKAIGRNPLSFDGLAESDVCC